MSVARFPLAGAVAAIAMLHGAAAPAFTGADGTVPPLLQRTSLYIQSRAGIVGLGFGFSPWWGPYDSYAPPAYAYPPPIYSVPPPRVSRAKTEVPAGPCRNFESTMILDGQQRIARGMACLQSDGTWRIVH